MIWETTSLPSSRSGFRKHARIRASITSMPAACGAAIWSDQIARQDIPSRRHGSHPTKRARNSPLLVPADGSESFDGIEVFVTSRQREIMDEAGGGDPAIVLGNDGTHFRKPGLQHAIALCDLVVQMHGLRQRKKGTDAPELLFPMFRMIGTIEKLPQDRDWQVKPG
jgi:hypothetical protein